MHSFYKTMPQTVPGHLSSATFTETTHTPSLEHIFSTSNGLYHKLHPQSRPVRTMVLYSTQQTTTLKLDSFKLRSEGGRTQSRPRPCAYRRNSFPVPRSLQRKLPGS